jgi:hypothetical protein
VLHWKKYSADAERQCGLDAFAEEHTGASVLQEMQS